MQKNRWLCWLCIVLGLAWVYASPTVAQKRQTPKKVDRRPSLLRAMKAEMGRSMNQLKMEGFQSPYFMAYEMKESDSKRIQARYGSIYQAGGGTTRRLRVEIRVGDYYLDNIGNKNSDFDFSWTPGYRAQRFGPLDDDPQSLRNSLWLLTDEAYKSALKAFLKVKSRKVTEVADDEFAGSFTKEKSVEHICARKNFAFDKERFEKLARTISSLFEDHPEIFDSHVSVDAGKEVRYLVTSEGSRIVTEHTLYGLTAQANTRAEDGMLLSNQMTLYASSGDELPSFKQLVKRVQQLITDLKALRNAPVLEPYTGPAILDGQATGVLFHEVIGHRLEGERQLDDKEGKTFKGQVNRNVIPSFLSVIDDPTLSRFGGQGLNGAYQFDDEGVVAKRVEMIRDGILKEFLLSRTPVKGFGHSNGHGRSSPGEMPRARMANTIVLSKKQVPYVQLEKMLIDEVRKQKKPYGLIIKNIVGGSTHTSSWGYQAYKGVPQLVYRVFPDGRKELVRGVEIVGTPLTSINKIIATSDKVSVFNGFCGAESGYVPVSAAAPDVLMTEIELQRTMKKAAKPPVIRSPWSIKSRH